jgi:nitrogen regulatory protein PII
MKKIEAIIQPSAFDQVKEVTTSISSATLDVAEVFRMGCTLVDKESQFAGYSAARNESARRLRIELVLPDADVSSAVHQLICLAHAEAVAVRNPAALMPTGHLL